MKICSVYGTDIVMFTRDEHCPPHVHANTNNCDLRIEFSFLHNDVRLLDATPVKNQPKIRDIQALCAEMKKEVNLTKVREAWVSVIGNVCLKNKYLFCFENELLLEPEYMDKKILNANYDSKQKVTILIIEGISETIEVEL